MIPEPQRINSPEELAVFANEHNLRHDWHEPDEQGIGAFVAGTVLDNAMGSHEPRYDNGGELNVIIVGWDKNELLRPVAVVNLASLLAWASQPHRAAVVR